MISLFILAIGNSSDKSKVERLYNTYSKYMFYAAYDILNDKYLSEDAVHHSFLKIIDNLHKIDENNCHKTKGFLVVICRNVAIDMYNQKLDLNIDEEILMDIEDKSSNIIDIVLNDEFLCDFKEKICKLKPIYRDVILLKYSHNMENDEIANLLDISSVNVRKRLERAKKMLIELIEKEKCKYD